MHSIDWICLPTEDLNDRLGAAIRELLLNWVKFEWEIEEDWNDDVEGDEILLIIEGKKYLGERLFLRKELLKVRRESIVIAIDWN